MSLLDSLRNFAIATVISGYSDTDTSIELEAGKGELFPDTNVETLFNLVWWNSTDYSDPAEDPNREIVRCTARLGDIMIITRAQEGTTATAKNTAGKTYTVMLAVTVKTIEDIKNSLDLKVERDSITNLQDQIDTKIESVVPGKNITVDNSDPLNPVIASLSDRYKTTSPSSHAIDTNVTLTFVVDDQLAYIPGQDVLIAYDANNHMHGTVVSYSGVTLVVEIKHKDGSGTYSEWSIVLDGLPIPTASPDTIFYKGAWNGIGTPYYPGGGLAQKGWMYYCVLACTIYDNYLGTKNWPGNSLMVANKNNADPYNNDDWSILLNGSVLSFPAVTVTRNATTKYISSAVTVDTFGAGTTSYTINRTGTRVSSITTARGTITITRDANGYYQSSNSL